MRWRFDSWVGKIPWTRKWQPNPVFLPGKFHGQKSPLGYSLWGRKRVGHDWAHSIHTRSKVGITTETEQNRRLLFTSSGTRAVGEMYAHLSYHFHMLLFVSQILLTCKPAHQWMPCWTVLHLRMHYPLVLHMPCRHYLQGQFLCLVIPAA